MNSESDLHELDLTEQEGALAATLLELLREDRNLQTSASASGSPFDLSEEGKSEISRRFALFRTDALADNFPQILPLIPEETRRQARGDVHHLTAIELETSHLDPIEELESCTWPDAAVGGIISARIRGAAQGTRTDPSDTAELLSVTVGALSTGETFSAVLDLKTPTRVGRNLVPVLSQALALSVGAMEAHK